MGPGDGTEKPDCAGTASTLGELHQPFAGVVGELLSNVVDRKDAAVVRPGRGMQETNDLEIPA